MSDTVTREAPNEALEAAEPIARIYGQLMEQLPLDLYIPPDAMAVMLDAFEGPLDLLLYMIRRAIDRGVSKERLARAFGVNLSSINRRINLLEGICPDAIARLQDKQFTPDVTRVLRNMKAARQVEAVELMVASNTITVAHADALLKATPPEQRTDFKPTERDKQLAPIEQIVKLEKEMSQVQTQYKDAEENYGSDLLNLVVAKGYLTKLLGNDAVKSYITRHEPEILEHFELVVNTVSMEEAVQQQLEADGGQLGPVAPPVEQGAAEGLLQPLDLLGQRRLRDEEPTGGLPVVGGLGQHDEGLQLSQVESHSIWLSNVAIY